jgi:prepilin-type N-terminal cleavage/methylation domain-containing protein
MRLRRDDRGVTLPEVLIAVTILAIIIIPLADALITFVRNTDATTRRLGESHDIQIANTYFDRDIQNLGTRNWGSAALTLQPSIDLSTANPCGTEPVVFSLTYDDPTATSGVPTVVHVAYLVRDVNGEHQLRRLQCQTSIVEVDDVVVHNLAPGTPDKPSCIPSPCSIPQWVTFTLTIQNPASTTPTTVTLTGQRGQT